MADVSDVAESLDSWGAIETELGKYRVGDTVRVNDHHGGSYVGKVCYLERGTGGSVTDITLNPYRDLRVVGFERRSRWWMLWTTDEGNENAAAKEISGLEVGSSSQIDHAISSNGILSTYLIAFKP